MAKLTLKANPTFKAKVAIPVPGGDDGVMTFTFKHITRAELEARTAAINGKVERGETLPTDVETVLECAVGWDLDEPFNAENVEVLLNQYHGAGRAIALGYALELTKARQGN